VIAWFAGQPLVLKIFLGGLGSLLLLFLLWRLWLWLRQYLEWQNVKTLEIKERVGLKIEFIKTAAQILGGVFFLITIYVAWANLEVSQDKYKTDLFVQAIRQLGDAKLEVRLGGIYALERIARDSEKDHGPIMEVLTAYVRENAPWPPIKANGAKEELAESKKPASGEKEPATNATPEIKPRTDIQAILTVIGRRTPGYDKRSLDLRHTDLRKTDLAQAPLETAILILANLHLTDLRYSNLKDANLAEVNLEEANLGGANLTQSILDGANLTRANLFGVNLQGAGLPGACLRRAHLERADLTGACLKGAILEGAILKEAKLAGANFRDAKRLTKEQIDSAIIDEKTKLPDYLKKADPDKAKPQ
jgi:uncharacterized protein YjbI with pentapeptide repeats